ncbi:MAG: bifunctional 3-deoxy-7-phosphoheptulonate synthase/chorismate mutase [Cyanobacteria bacterium]|nr:bifunctional 3-deoxy-7-phosphoheptulonate synthase/chorismate mutase [Cyanobacteriota bacterium]
MPSQKLLHQRADAQDTTSTSLVKVGNVIFGGHESVLIAGPCAVESRDQLEQVAQTLHQLGIPCLRGGAFKPRTSPYSFQGMGEEGLQLLAEMGKKYDLAVITEVMSVEQMEMAADYVDCFQVGSRNMQNFELLKALGKSHHPILLKRGLAATLEEFLMAAEYIMAEGNEQVILCERGIRSFDPMTRNVFDLGAVALLKELTHLPVIADPSHATGKRSLVGPVAKAALAVGSDGLIIEAHPVPEKSVSDASQALSLPDLVKLSGQLALVAQSVDRTLTVHQQPKAMMSPLGVGMGAPVMGPILINGAQPMNPVLF